MISKRMNKQIA